MPLNPGRKVEQLFKFNKWAWLDLIILVELDFGNHWVVDRGHCQQPFTLQNWLHTWLLKKESIPFSPKSVGPYWQRREHTATSVSSKRLLLLLNLLFLYRPYEREHAFNNESNVNAIMKKIESAHFFCKKQKKEQKHPNIKLNFTWRSQTNKFPPLRW